MAVGADPHVADAAETADQLALLVDNAAVLDVEPHQQLVLECADQHALLFRRVGTR